MLLHFDNINNQYRDECGNIWTAYNNPTITDENAKFGKALFVASSNQYLESNISIELGGQDYTISYWFYSTYTKSCSLNSWACQFIIWNTSNRYNRIQSGDAGQISWGKYDRSGGPLLKQSLPRNQLTHIAYTYKHSKSEQYLFINGIKVATQVATVDRLLYSKARIAHSFNTDYYTGYLDEICVLDGIALWTEDFVPPDEPYMIV